MSVEVQVAGMSCGHCVNTIRQAVLPLTGVTGVAVDLAVGAVTIGGDPDVLAVTAAITKAGYHVQAVTDESRRPPLPLAASADGDCCCG